MKNLSIRKEFLPAEDPTSGLLCVFRNDENGFFTVVVKDMLDQNGMIPVDIYFRPLNAGTYQIPIQISIELWEDESVDIISLFREMAEEKTKRLSVQ